MVEIKTNISLEETLDYKLIHSIITEPKLFIASGQSGTPETFKVNETFRYLLIKKEDVILGCFQFRELTKILVECHIHLLPKYWGKDNISVEASLLGFEWLKDNTKFRKAFTDVPSVCEHVLNLAQKVGWNACGMIKNGVIYNNILTDLIFLDRDLR